VQFRAPFVSTAVAEPDAFDLSLMTFECFRSSRRPWQATRIPARYPYTHPRGSEMS